MAVKTIDVELFTKMFLAGAQNIEAHKENINELNVFPVPDGDTGTNMTMTIMSAVKEISALDHPTMNEVAKAISSGSLRGARGNSGVILSQLLRGFTKVIREVDEINVKVLTEAFVRAKETAYKAVMKPKEGTILTVASGIADKAVEQETQTDDLEEFMPVIVEYADEFLQGTPELLPVLKEAGVLDSGGQGLVEILRGALDAFQGKEVDYDALASNVSEASSGQEKAASDNPARGNIKHDDIETADIKFGYCTEFMILTGRELTDEEEQDLKGYLMSIGDSIVCVSDDEVTKVHVHTNDPGLAIQKGLSFGPLSHMKIDNMREQHNEILIEDAERIAAEEAAEDEQMEAESEADDKPRKPMGFIAVSTGDGLNEIFRELGVDYIIAGGQTMNPSTEDMLTAINHVNADTIYILPNNKNILMAAEQARDFTMDKDVIVIPTKTVPQGITAMISFSPDCDAKTNEENMMSQIENVKSGQVTYAVRDTRIDNIEIHEGDIMGIGDDGILAVSPFVDETTREMLESLVDEDSELISMYYGQEVEDADAEKLMAEIEGKYPDIDVDVQYGGQPIYYYVLAVE